MQQVFILKPLPNNQEKKNQKRFSSKPCLLLLQSGSLGKQRMKEGKEKTNKLERKCPECTMSNKYNMTERNTKYVWYFLQMNEMKKKKQLRENQHNADPLFSILRKHENCDKDTETIILTIINDKHRFIEANINTIIAASYSLLSANKIHGRVA